MSCIVLFHGVLVVAVLVTGPGHHTGLVPGAVPVTVHMKTLTTGLILYLTPKVRSGNLTQQRVYNLASSVSILRWKINNRLKFYFRSPTLSFR